MRKIAVLAVLGCMINPIHAAKIEYKKGTETSSFSRSHVTDLKVSSNLGRFTLTAATAQLTDRVDSAAAASAYLPAGGEIAGTFGTFRLGKGEVWLPTMSWSGDVGAVLELVPNEQVESGAIGLGGVHACSDRKTLQRTGSDGTVVDVGAAGAIFSISNGADVSLNCARGLLEVTFRDAPPLIN